MPIAHTFSNIALSSIAKALVLLAILETVRRGLARVSTEADPGLTRVRFAAGSLQSYFSEQSNTSQSSTIAL
jgi:hypothetical protein